MFFGRHFYFNWHNFSVIGMFFKQASLSVFPIIGNTAPKWFEISYTHFKNCLLLTKRRKKETCLFLHGRSGVQGSRLSLPDGEGAKIGVVFLMKHESSAAEEEHQLVHWVCWSSSKHSDYWGWTWHSDPSTSMRSIYGGSQLISRS